MLTFLEMPYAYSAWIQRWGLSGIFWISTASLTHAAQPLPQELINQWFAVEVLSGARIPLSIEFVPSPWSLIRLRLAPDERLLVLFNAPVQECTISGDARLDPDRPRHVGVLLGNTPFFCTVLVAAALSGIVPVGLNPTRRGAALQDRKSVV